MAPQADLDLLLDLCRQPTAAFLEDKPLAVVDEFAAGLKHVQRKTDRWGNRLFTLPGTDRKAPRIVFVAHLDHPGFASGEMNPDDKTLACEFRGGVLASYLPETKVRFFTDDGEVRGKVVSAEGDERGYATSAVVRVKKLVPPNVPGMFDLPAGKLGKRKFRGRVCDDLAGAAACLAALRRLHELEDKPASDFGVLLTRGEEVGFIGAIAAATKRPTLLRKSDSLISVECSAEQPAAQQGKGVVLRIGDKVSVFDSALGRFMTEQADALAEGDKKFKYSRALMPGGACEATPFNAYGYRAAAACVPLRNYHNMDRDKQRIAAEAIDLRDWSNMVALFTRLGQTHGEFDPTQPDLKTKLAERFDKWQGHLSA
jgi:putative aminopeptidase FrvX